MVLPHRELCHDGLHALELLRLEGEQRLLGIQALQVDTVGVERFVVKLGEGRADLCKKDSAQTASGQNFSGLNFLTA